jgi:dUTP pyrophosphatase
MSHEPVQNIYYVAGKDAQVPTRGSKHAAGWDLYAAEDAVLTPFKSMTIATHLAIEIPEWYVYFLFPRSGFSIKQQMILPNSVGVIDEDFRGNMLLAMMWMPDPISVIETYIVTNDPYEFPEKPLHEVKLRYREDARFEIKKGDRITQGILMPYAEQVWHAKESLTPTDRGTGGLGSTGIRAKDPGCAG